MWWLAAALGVVVPLGWWIVRYEVEDKGRFRRMVRELGLRSCGETWPEGLPRPSVWVVPGRLRHCYMGRVRGYAVAVFEVQVAARGVVVRETIVAVERGRFAIELPPMLTGSDRLQLTTPTVDFETIPGWVLARVSGRRLRARQVETLLGALTEEIAAASIDVMQMQEL